MQVPSDEDWHPIRPHDLDKAWAYKNFHAKSFDEAVRLFEDNAIHYQEDLMYMPVPVFGFYLRAYMSYLLSEAGKDDSDGASCFVHLIGFKAEHDREILIPLWSIIEPVLKHLVEHQDDYGAIWEIYGSFRSQAHQIAGRGFAMSFDTSIPEVVPKSATVGKMAYHSHPLTLPAALQVFRNSGIHEIDETSTKEDVVRILGLPQKSGGGEHSEYGWIPHWFLYDHPLCTLRVEFDDELISRLTMMPPQGSGGVDPEIAKFLSPETLQSFAILHAPPNLRGGEDPKIPKFLDALTRFEKLFQDREVSES